MQRLTRLALLSILAISLPACELPTPSPPPGEMLTQGMIEALVDTGLYSEAVITRIIGHHYVPSARAWEVFACFEFRLPGGEQGATCVDSFRALKLQGGIWVVSVTIDGVYRWRAVSGTGESQGNPGAANTSDPVNRSQGNL